MEAEGIKISQLEELSEIKGSELIPVADGSSNKKLSTGKFATQEQLKHKQDTLVSGQNLATINGKSLLEGGDIIISGGEEGISDYSALSNKPKINNIELSGNKYLDELGVQPTLQSGTNIKTINGQSVLGEGNIEIQGGGDGIPDAPSDGKKYVRSNGNWVQETTVDTSSFATKSELEGKADSAELDDKLSKTEAQQTYQPKGDYASKSEIPDVSGFITSTQADEKYATLEQIGSIDAILDSINGEVV